MTSTEPSMHPRIEELLTYITERRVELRDAADSVPRDRWSIAPGADRWSVADVLEHLGIVESRIATLLEKKIGEARQTGLGAETDDTPQLDGMRLERYLDRATRLKSPTALQRTGKSPDAAWAGVQQSREALLAAIRTGDGLALATLSAPHLYFGPLNLYEWIAFTGAHEARHAAQIREIGAALA